MSENNSGGANSAGSKGNQNQTTIDDRPSGPTRTMEETPTPTRAQSDIRKLLDALSEYTYTSNNLNSGGPKDHKSAVRKNLPEDIASAAITKTSSAVSHTLPPLTAQIPKTLVGFVGTHCEVDIKAVAQAASGIVEFCQGGTPQRGLLQNEFRRVLRTGGTEIVLQALARITSKRNSKNTNQKKISNPSGAESGVVATTFTETSDAIFKEAIFHCWGVARAGVTSGLSKNTLVMVVRSCIAAMNQLETAWHETATTTNSSSSTSTSTSASTTSNKGNDKSSDDLLLKTLLCVLETLMKALSSQHITADDLYYEQVTILASSLALLGQACCCSDGDDDRDAEIQIIGIIEEILGILVVCARKGLIRGHDFQRLVPACQASLSRYQMATASSGSSIINSSISNSPIDNDPVDSTSSNANANVGKKIVVRVVELIELEDNTVGLWLRHTYGITPSSSFEEESSGQPANSSGAVAAASGVDLLSAFSNGMVSPQESAWLAATVAARGVANPTAVSGSGIGSGGSNNSEAPFRNPPPSPARGPTHHFHSIALGGPEGGMDIEEEDDDDDEDIDY